MCVPECVFVVVVVRACVQRTRTTTTRTCSHKERASVRQRQRASRSRFLRLASDGLTWMSSFFSSSMSTAIGYRESSDALSLAAIIDAHTHVDRARRVVMWRVRARKVLLLRPQFGCLRSLTHTHTHRNTRNVHTNTHRGSLTQTRTHTQRHLANARTHQQALGKSVGNRRKHTLTHTPAPPERLRKGVVLDCWGGGTRLLYCWAECALAGVLVKVGFFCRRRMRKRCDGRSLCGRKTAATGCCAERWWWWILSLSHSLWLVENETRTGGEMKDGRFWWRIAERMTVGHWTVPNWGFSGCGAEGAVECSKMLFVFS